MNSYKVNAYTLMEITVAMLLSAIVISICYTAYGMIGDYFQVFKIHNERNDQLLTLNHVLERDILKSKYIIASEQGFVIENDSTRIDYSFASHQVLRAVTDLHTDTFSIPNKGVLMQFEGKETQPTDTVSEIGFSLLINKGIEVSLHFKKLYSSDQLFK